MTVFRNFPMRAPAPIDERPKPFGRREPGALEEKETGSDWVGPVKLVAFVAGCAVLGALAAGVM